MPATALSRRVARSSTTDASGARFAQVRPGTPLVSCTADPQPKEPDVKATRLLPCIALVLVACGGSDPGFATFEAADKAEMIVNPKAVNQKQGEQTLDIQIEGDRADDDPAHAVVFLVNVPTTPGAFDCTSAAPAVTYYEPSGSTPGAPSFVAPTWAASSLTPGTSCSGEWQQQGSRMVGSFSATMMQLLVDSTQTLAASGTFDVPMP